MALKDITREAVLSAIREYDRLGQDEFLRTYGFKEARSYRLIHNGIPYDSKAIVGVAHGFLPGEKALAANEFSGGEATVGRLLRRLGFTLEVQTAAWGAGTLARLGALRQNSSSGSPAPHKPLLFLLALGRLQQNGSSELPWSVASVELADLITRFTPAASTTPIQRAAYPFTRLRADGVWLLDRDVAMDSVGDLNAGPVTGRIEPSLEAAIQEDPALAREVARRLATENFPTKKTARAVLRAVGLNADAILGTIPPRPRPRSRYQLADYLDLTENGARQQFQELLKREPAAEGERQDVFMPVETLLCLAAADLVNHRQFGGSTAHLAPEPVPSLARLFRRRPSSVLAKMANLDGSRPNGARWDEEVGRSLREQPTRFEHVYRVLFQAARAEGLGRDRLPDFLELAADHAQVVSAESDETPGSRSMRVTAGHDAFVAGRDIRVQDLHIHVPDGASDTSRQWEDLVASESSVPLLDEDPRRVDRYALVRRLGQGTMGVVYLARDPARRPVALKLVRPEFVRDESFLRRFAQEVELASRVDAVYTAKVLDSGADAGRPYLVTEFIDGPTLEAEVNSHGALSSGDVKGVAIGTATALIAIHNAEIVHRDLKPSNVILSRFHPRVIDFGISRSLNATTRLTIAGGLLGSPAYMSPEQIEGEEATSASDIFSWAGLMVYISTGHRPFGEESTGPLALMRQVVDKEADLSGVPRDLHDLIAAGLRKDPRSRPTAMQVRDALTGT